MSSQSDYFVVRTGALPEVLKKVVEVKRLLETEKGLSVAEATERVGISRSSFYKYKEDIFPFYDSSKADAGCTRKSGEDLLEGVLV